MNAAPPTSIHIGSPLSAFFRIGWAQARMMVQRPMNLATGIVTPLMFMVLFTVPRLADLTPEIVTRAFVSSLLASFWAASLWSAAGIIRRERWTGTLGPTLSGRWPAALVLSAKTFGATVYDLSLITVSASLYLLVLRLPVTIDHPLALGLGLVCTAICGNAGSLLLGSTLILSRHAFYLTNALGTPILLLGGILVPSSLLPGPFQLVAPLLNLSWLRSFLISTATTPRYGYLLVALGISTVYFLLALLSIRVMLHRARIEGTLELS